MDLLEHSTVEVARYQDDVYLRRGDAIELHGKHLVVESRCLKPVGYVFSEPSAFDVEHAIASRDIKAWHAAGKLTFVSKDEFGLPIGVRENLRRSLRAFTLVERKEIVRRLRYCRALDDQGPGFARSEVSLQPVCDRVAAERGDEGPHDWSSVYRWWQVWSRAGRDPRALCPRTAKRGNRTRKLEEYQLKAMRDAIETDYLRRHRPKFTTAYKACTANIVKALGGIEKAREVRDRMAQDVDPAKRSPFPSLKAFTAECRRMSPVVRAVTRLGADAARQRFYPVGAGPDVRAPFERVEADFKYLRLFVLDDEGEVPLGTPYLMAAIDCFSGCIAGYDISFDPPSYVSAARTLRHVISFKDTAFGTNDDGEPHVRNTYPINGVPSVFVVDNDQAFHSSSFIRSAGALGCNIHYIPPSQSWKKGRIERFWRTVQDSYLDMFPGKVLRYGDKPGRDYKPEDDAVVTLSQLRLFITKAIVDIHHEEIDEASGKRRIDLWTEAAAKWPPRRVRSHDDLVELVGAYTTRNAERRGLRLFGLRYNSPELARYRAGFESDQRVEVRYDPQDIGSVTLIDPKRGFTLRVPCTRPDYADGLTLHQHQVVQRRAKDRGPEGRIRMDDLKIAKAELFKLGREMLKVRRGRRRLTKVAQFLGEGREIIDLMSRRREDPKKSSTELKLSEDDVDDPEDVVDDPDDDRQGRTDESLVETLREVEGKRPSKPRNARRPTKAEAAPEQREESRQAPVAVDETPATSTVQPGRTPRKLKVTYDG